MLNLWNVHDFIGKRKSFHFLQLKSGWILQGVTKILQGRKLSTQGNRKPGKKFN